VVKRQEGPGSLLLKWLPLVVLLGGLAASWVGSQQRQAVFEAEIRADLKAFKEQAVREVQAAEKERELLRYRVRRLEETK
jgi:hypothetical protein